MTTCTYCGEDHYLESEYCSERCKDLDEIASLPKDQLFSMDNFQKEMYLSGKPETQSVYYEPVKIVMSNKNR